MRHTLLILRENRLAWRTMAVGNARKGKCLNLLVFGDDTIQSKLEGTYCSVTKICWKQKHMSAFVIVAVHVLVDWMLLSVPIYIRYGLHPSLRIDSTAWMWFYRSRNCDLPTKPLGFVLLKPRLHFLRRVRCTSVLAVILVFAKCVWFNIKALESNNLSAKTCGLRHP